MSDCIFLFTYWQFLSLALLLPLLLISLELPLLLLVEIQTTRSSGSCRLLIPAFCLNHSKNLCWVLFLVLVELFPAPHLISHNASNKPFMSSFIDSNQLWGAGSILSLVVETGFSGSTSSKESSCQCRRHKRHRFDPWIRKTPWRRAWQPTPVFSSGETMDRGGYWATFHRVTKSQTQLKRLSMHVSILSLQGGQNSHQCSYLLATLGLHSHVRTVAASTQGTSSLVGHSLHHS